MNSALRTGYFRRLPSDSLLPNNSRNVFDQPIDIDKLIEAPSQLALGAFQYSRSCVIVTNCLCGLLRLGRLWLLPAAMGDSWAWCLC